MAQFSRAHWPLAAQQRSLLDMRVSLSLPCCSQVGDMGYTTQHPDEFKFHAYYNEAMGWLLDVHLGS